MKTLVRGEHRFEWVAEFAALGGRHEEWYVRGRSPDTLWGCLAVCQGRLQHLRSMRRIGMPVVYRVRNVNTAQIILVGST